LMDYPNRQRIKIWGRAEYVELDSEVLRAVADADYDAKLERAVVFHIEAWDSNCPQHITPRYSVEELGELGGLRELGARVSEQVPAAAADD